MKIGIGITTTPNRKHLLDECLTAHSKYTKLDILVYNDEDFNGVAYAKNQLLKDLRHNDYVFLLDDDICPTRQGWVDYIINLHELSHQHHFLFMHPKHHKFVKTWQPSNEISIDIYDDCSGVFMSFTKQCLDTVGYFDSRYKQYGYEHAGLSRRIHLAGLNAKPFMSPSQLGEYLAAKDFEGNIESSISEELKEANMQHNDEIYHDELRNWHDLYRGL
jgi:hypothetical protein